MAISRATASGPASSTLGMTFRCRSASTPSRPSRFVLRRLLEVCESVVPHPRQVLAQLGEGLTIGREQMSGAFPALVHQTGVPQDAQMLRDGRSGDVEVGGDI